MQCGAARRKKEVSMHVFGNFYQFADFRHLYKPGE